MNLTAHVRDDLRELCAYPDRHVGGPGNRAATEFFARRMERWGYRVSRTDFDCVEWAPGAAALSLDGEDHALHAGPYSLPCDVRAPLRSATRVEDLESEQVRGAVVLIHGALAAGQIMPKNFRFYNPDEHKRLVRALEEFQPAAVVAATGRDPGMVGSQYPFPLFEDGDLDVPNAFMRDVDGERLLAHLGREVALRIDSGRVPSSAEQVVATVPGDVPGKVVVSAHIDSRKGSPGALDNASGVATLLGLAELLWDYEHGPDIEIVPFNGEDDYASPGELLWIAANEKTFDEIIVGINVDDLGMKGTENHVSFYGCPPDLETAVRDEMKRHARLEEGPRWYQSDHAIFGMYGRPAIALTSSGMERFMAEYAHSERDTLEIADPELIAEAARFLRGALDGIAGLPPALKGRRR